MAGATPLFLRGSMNDWSTSIPLARDQGGTLSAEIPLQPGDYQFKLAAENWQAADFGASGPEPIVGGTEGFVLVPHGGNIRLSVATPGRYRFALTIADGRTSLAIHRLGDL